MPLCVRRIQVSRWGIGDTGVGDLSYGEHQSVFSAPAVPLGTAADAREVIKHGVYTEGVTRRLSAAAFARTDWLAVLRAELARLWKELKAAVKKRLRWLFPPKEAEKAPGSSEPAPPSVVVGEDYAVWVRRRIKKSKRPVPPSWFTSLTRAAFCASPSGRTSWPRSTRRSPVSSPPTRGA